MLACALLGLGGCAPRSLLYDVSFSADWITPNADHDRDVLEIRFGLTRSADISIYFLDEQGTRYTFRERVPHPPSVEQPYQVYFAGVVNGYLLPGEEFEGFTVERRVLQDGRYTWVVEATAPDGATEQVTGTLTIAQADTALPELRGFSIHPPAFSPNRDGINDRATINVDLTKDVAELTVYLTGPDGTRYHVEEKEGVVAPNQAGWHEFDYDAGVDLSLIHI